MGVINQRFSLVIATRLRLGRALWSSFLRLSAGKRGKQRGYKPRDNKFYGTYVFSSVPVFLNETTRHEEGLWPSYHYILWLPGQLSRGGISILGISLFYELYVMRLGDGWGREGDWPLLWAHFRWKSQCGWGLYNWYYLYLSAIDSVLVLQERKSSG